MKMWLTCEGERVAIATPFEGADHAVVTGGACPGCGASPFKIAGDGRRPSIDDRAWEADGYALCCKRCVGVIRVEPSTLFGVREDEAVMNRYGTRIYL